MHAWTDRNLKILNIKKAFPEIYKKLEVLEVSEE